MDAVMALVARPVDRSVSAAHGAGEAARSSRTAWSRKEAPKESSPPRTAAAVPPATIRTSTVTSLETCRAKMARLWDYRTGGRSAGGARIGGRFFALGRVGSTDAPERDAARFGAFARSEWSVRPD